MGRGNVERLGKEIISVDESGNVTSGPSTWSGNREERVGGGGLIFTLLIRSGSRDQANNVPAKVLLFKFLL